MSPSRVPVQLYEKKEVARPASASVPPSPPARTTLSASERPVDRVSAHTLVSQPCSLHTTSIVLDSPPWSA
eukprot:6513195-Prymnesium_polylepis.1